MREVKDYRRQIACLKFNNFVSAFGDMYASGFLYRKGIVDLFATVGRLNSVACHGRKHVAEVQTRRKVLSNVVHFNSFGLEMRVGPFSERFGLHASLVPAPWAPGSAAWALLLGPCSLILLPCECFLTRFF